MVSINCVGFRQQAQPRQVAQQAAQHALEARARPRSAADCRRGPGRRTSSDCCESAASSSRHCLRTPATSPRNRARSVSSDRPLPAPVGLGRRRHGHHGADQPAGVAGLDRGGDDLLQQRLLDAAAVVVFDQRLLRAPRRRNAIAVDRRQQFQQPLAIGRRPGASQPASDLVAVGRRRRGGGGHGGHLPQLGHGAEKGQPAEDPLGLHDEFDVGGVLPAFEHFAFEAVVGAVAIAHVLVGRLKRSSSASSAPRLPRVSLLARRLRRRPARTAALASTPRRWLRGNRETSATAPSGPALPFDRRRRIVAG